MASMDYLPDDCIRSIINHLSYHEVSQLRIVSQRLNKLCSDTLNAGFRKFRQMHETCLREVKDRLPRRESHRVGHYLNIRHTTLLAIDTRVSLLMMTYHRHILDKLICFIPGKVLDELFRLLRLLQDRDAVIPKVPGNFGFLQELRDLSSMAIEHFDDHIAPSISSNDHPEKISSRKRPSRETPGTFGDSVLADTRRRDEVNILKNKVNAQECYLLALKSKLQSQKKAVESLQSTVIQQNGRIAEMSRQVTGIQKFLNFPHIDDGRPNKEVFDSDATPSGAKRKRRAGNSVFSKQPKLDDSNTPCDVHSGT